MKTKLFLIDVCCFDKKFFANARAFIFLAAATLDDLFGLLVDTIGNLREGSLLQQILFWSRFLVVFVAISGNGRFLG